MKKGKRRLKKKVRVVISLITLTFIVTGIVIIVNSSNFELASNKEKNNIKTENIEPEEEYIPPVSIIDINSKSRPYAVMINNLSTARPYHSGLQDAYIMYEVIVEGGVTRYMALFKDADTQVIGSVRSSRHYYLDYVLENDAYYAHWGWSPQAQDDIKTYGIENINGLTYEGKYFYRESLPIASEHTGFTTMTMLKEAVEKIGYRTETNKDLLFNYSSLPVEYTETNSAKKVTIKFSSSVTSSFEYDEEKESYLMWVNGTSHDDYQTKQQYHFKNIITYEIKNNVMAGESTRQEIHNIGEGSGYYISRGESIEITWEKTSREAQTIYKIASTGEELVVNDGNTYIALQPLDQELIIE